MNPEAFHISLNLQAILICLGIFSGLITGIRLLITDKNRRPNTILAVGVLTASVLMTGMLVVISGDDIPDIHTLRSIGSFTLFYSPFVYLYLRASVQKDFSFSGRTWMHLLPPALVVITLFVTRPLVDAPDPPFNGTNSPPLPALLVAVVLLSYILSYFVIAARLLRKHQQFVQENSSFTDQLHSKWLMMLFSVFLIPLLFVLLNVITVQMFHQVPYPAIGPAVMLIVLHLVLMFSPQVFVGFPQALQFEQETTTEQKYQSSSLDESQKDHIYQQLRDCMESEQLFTNQDLALRDLSEKLGINGKYLSQVINEKSGSHFMDYVNEYRIDLAKEMIHNHSYQHYTVVGIAQEVGFRSRSAFYSAFKKFTGLTPSEFRKQPAG